MAKILVTGIAGTGKSTALAELAERGYRVVDTDDAGWSEYRPYSEPPDELHRGEYHWIADRMDPYLATPDGRSLFVAGWAHNMAEFADRFDAVVLFTAPIDVLLERVSSRTKNDYGKTALERAEMVVDVTEIVPLLRAVCTHEIDANRPLADVVAELMAIAERPAEPLRP